METNGDKTIQKEQPKNKNKFWEVVTWFKRGYSNWLVYFFGIAQFITVIYKLLIESIPMLEAIFFSLFAFIVFYLVTVIPVAIFIGWWDYKRGSVKTESSVAILASPWYTDVAKALVLICDDKKDEAKKVLAKWISDDK